MNKTHLLTRLAFQLASNILKTPEGGSFKVDAPALVLTEGYAVSADRVALRLPGRIINAGHEALASIIFGWLLLVDQENLLTAPDHVLGWWADSDPSFADPDRAYLWLDANIIYDREDVAIERAREQYQKSIYSFPTQSLILVPEAFPPSSPARDFLGDEASPEVYQLESPSEL